MNSGKQKVSPEKARRILRIHNWVASVILVVVPVIITVIVGYSNVWHVIFLLGGCALLAWNMFWTNWINSVILTVVAAVFVANAAYRSVWDGIIAFLILGFLVLSRWFSLWVKKRISEDFGEDKK